jgi:hypothetical protein
MDVDEFARIGREDGLPLADAAGADQTDAGTPPASDAGAHDDVCPVVFCPIGMALSTASQMRPEAIEHLIAAGRELMLAARSALDAGGDDRGASSLQRIRID